MTVARLSPLPRRAWMHVCAAALTIALSNAAVAQEAQAPETQAPETQAPKINPVGTSSSWSTDVNANGTVSGMVLDDKQLALVAKINTYFNSMGDLKGNFQQTDAQGALTKGKFFIRRPGRFRFVYAAPSKMIVLSDGENLSFEDHDINSADRYPLESTPFRVLLSENVDLSRDATILELNETPREIVIALQDKADESTGKIRVFFNVAGDQLEFREWLITGPQGGDTRVVLAGLVRDEKVDDKFFQPTPFMPIVDNGRRK